MLNSMQFALFVVKFIYCFYKIFKAERKSIDAEIFNCTIYTVTIYAKSACDEC